MIAGHFSRVILVAGLVSTVAVAAVSAQRGGRGGANIQAGGSSGAKASRMELMTQAFTLDEEQVKHFRAAFDEGQKNAIPIKAALVEAHAAIGLAIQGAKGQPEVDKAVLEYANQSAAMTALEVKALATAMKSLRPEQVANERAVTGTLALLHGMFLGKWDTVPDGKKY